MTRPLALEDLYAFRVPSDPQLSPDGRTVAFTLTQANRETDKDRSSIWTMPVAGGAPRRLTTGDADAQPRWSPDGTRLAFLSSRDDEPAQIFVLPLDGGEATRLTDLPLGAGEPVWSPDGSRIAFTAPVDLDHDPELDEETARSRPIVITRLDHKADGAGRLRGMRPHVFAVGVDGEPPLQLTSGDFFAAGPVWSPDGSRIAFTASLAEDRDLVYSSAVHVVPASGGPRATVTPVDGAFAIAAWPADDTMVLVGAEKVAVGHAKLYSVSPDEGGAKPLLPGYDRNVMVGAPGYPGAMPRVDAGGRLLFCARERGRVHILAVVPGEQAPHLVVGGDRVVAGMSEAGGTVAFVAGSADSPGDLYVLDGAGDRRLTTFFSDDLPDVELATPEPRSFTAPDGTTVEGWVLRGAAGGRTPVLLDVHGGPHNAWGPAFDPVHLYHQTLAARGWTILYVNPRGSDGYGESFWSALVDGGWGRADEDDFFAAIDALVEEGSADPDRIAVTGYSYGGEMTCWLTARSDRFAAAVAGGCVSNMVSMSGTSDAGWFIRSLELGRPSYDDPSLVELSPITHVANVTTPTLVLHGAADDRCPPGQAEEWFTALRAQRVPAELVLYPDASHLFILSGKPSHRLDYNARVEQWVTKYAGEGRVSDLQTPTRLRGFSSRFRAALDRHRVPGGSIAILDGDDLLEVAAGVLNVNTGERATPGSLFQIGSITKSYAATLVMQLVDEGRLDLDVPVTRYLPEFSVLDEDVTTRVTMRHLLSHTSGIQGDHFVDTGRGDDCVRRFVETCAELGQSHPLGATMSYCNTGYVVAGAVIEELTGMTWDDALRTRLAEPLGLERTVTLAEDALRFGVAFGHVVEAGKAAEAAPQWSLPRSCGPAGLICSTAADVVNFARMHLDDGRGRNGKQVLSPGSVKAMQQEQIVIPDPYTLGSHWGLGWILFDWDGRRLFGHDGNTIGQSAFLRILPERNLAVALLTNGGNAHDLFVDVYGELLGDLAGIRLPAGLEPAGGETRMDASRYAGTYERVGARIEIAERDGDLVATTTVTGTLAELVPDPVHEHVLLPAGEDLFVTRDEGQESWTPLVFFELPDGTLCIHSGARATPKVG